MTNIYKKVSIYSKERIFICDTILLSKKDEVVTMIVPEEAVDIIYTNMILTLYDDVYGLITYRAELIDFKKEIIQSNFEYTVQFHLIEKLEVVQRRSNVKVKTMIPTKIKLVDEDGKIIIDEETKEPIEYEGTIRDISAAGILLITKEELNIGQNFTFLFEKCKNPFEITAEILRHQPQENDKTIKGYGCQFLDLSLTEESYVRQYVFRVQVIEKKRDSSDWIHDEDEDLENAE